MIEPFENATASVALLVATLLGIRALLALLQRRGSGSGRRLRVVESCALSQRQRLHVVEVEGRRVLVGATDHGIQLLERLQENVSSQADEAPAKKSPLRALASTLVWIVLATLPADAIAASDLDLASLREATQPERLAATIEVLGLLTLVSVAPSLLLLGTCFTRIVIVLSLMRQAIGVNQLPPNQVLVGLALILTIYAMTPVAESVRTNAVDPYIAEEIDARKLQWSTELDRFASSCCVKRGARTSLSSRS